MKNCLIYLHGGIGDIFWSMPIVDKYINDGYKVYFPLYIYQNIIPNYIEKNNLIWNNPIEDNFPMKDMLGSEYEFSDDNNLYVPLSYSDFYVRTPVMSSRFFYTNTKISDWRKHLEVKRNLTREKELIKKYNLDGDYILINKSWSWVLDRDLKINTKYKTHIIDYDQDKENGFHLFDWIGALEKAKEVHSVGTSLCYLIDKYCIDNEIYLYERRIKNQARTYHQEIHLVYRNPNWIYMD
jgi:hypothetical protein